MAVTVTHSEMRIPSRILDGCLAYYTYSRLDDPVFLKQWGVSLICKTLDRDGQFESSVIKISFKNPDDCICFRRRI